MMVKCKLYYTILVVLNAFLLKHVFTIVTPNEGVKSKTFRQDPRTTDSFHVENQPILMHHQYSQVVSNKPGLQYSGQYNQQKTGNTTTITTTKTTTTASQTYQGSNKVYQENIHVNNNRGTDRLGRTSSKLDEVENNITPYQTECPQDATGQFPYSLDCRRFLNCWKGRGYIQSCAPGTVFNPITLECDNPKKVNCLGFGVDYGRIKGEYFEKLQESSPRTTFTTTTSFTNNDVKCLPGANGIHEHPFDCSKFLNCVNGLTHIQSCAPGTLFNILKSVCDYPHNVDCGKERKIIVDTANEYYEARRPYIYENTNLSQGTKIYPSSLAQQNTNWRYSQQKYSHQHTSNCDHESHKKNKDQTTTQNIGQITAWTKSNVHYSQPSEVTQVVYPTNWSWHTARNSSQVNDLTSLRNESSIQVIYPEHEGRKSLSSVWRESDEEDGQLSVNLEHSNWPESSNNQHTTSTSTFYSRSQIKQPEYVKQHQTSYSSYPSGSSYYYIRRPNTQLNRVNQTTWTSTTTQQTPFGTYPYQQVYNQNQNWTSTSSTRGYNIPWPLSPSYEGNIFVQQAVVKQIPQSNYNSSITSNNTRIYYPESLYNFNESDFDNITGGDITVHPSIYRNKNKTLPHSQFEEPIEISQQIVPFETSNHQKYNEEDIISSKSLHHETVSSNEKSFDESDNLFGGLLPPYSSLEASTPSTNLLQSHINGSRQHKISNYASVVNSNEKIENVDENVPTGLVSPHSSLKPQIPSEYLFPPLPSQENKNWKSSSNRTETITTTNEKQKNFNSHSYDSIPLDTSSSILEPLEHMVPSLRTEESLQKPMKILNNPISVPTSHMSPPLTSQGSNQRTFEIKNYTSISIPSSHNSSPMLHEKEYQRQINLPKKFPVPIPSDHMLPPLSSEEEGQQINYPVPSSSFSTPLDFMMPPLTPEEERQKVKSRIENLPFQIPSDYMLPPLYSEEEYRKIINVTSGQLISSSVINPTDKMLSPLTPEEERQKVKGRIENHPISIPSDHMLPSSSSEPSEKVDQKIINPVYSFSPSTPLNSMMPPLTPEEERQKVKSRIENLPFQIPSDYMLPPLSSEEEYQKIINVTSGKLISSSVVNPTNKELPPLISEEGVQKAFNSTRKVIALNSKKNTVESHSLIKGEQFSPQLVTTRIPQNHFWQHSKQNTSRTQYNPSYSSITHFTNWSQITNKNYSRESTSNDETKDNIYYRAQQDLNKNVESGHLVNDSIVVESPAIKVISQLPSAYHFTTTRAPYYSAYNREYYKGSSLLTKSNPDSSEVVVSNLPVNEAIKLLLRPYLNRSGTITDEDVEKTETHIMKVIKNSENIKNNQEDARPHEKDVEFIFTGEQPNPDQGLLEEYSYSGRDQLSNHSHHYNHHHHSHHNYHDYHHGHSEQFHHNNPHLPNPFENSNNNNDYDYFGHNREFHENNPQLPNPFESLSSTNNFGMSERKANSSKPTPLSNIGTLPAPGSRDKIDIRFSFSYNSKPTHFPERRQFLTTTTTSISRSSFDVDCKFDCQNGKCVKEFEVCDGVNNCGNRLDEKFCDHLGYEVRLSNEEGEKHVGRVEIQILGKWGYVCDDKFGMNDADVLCRELGFPLGASEIRGNSYYPPHAEMIDKNNEILFVMDEVDCKGNETSLKECDFKGWGVHDCNADEVVGVVCKIPIMTCPRDYWLCSTSKECIPPAFVCDNVDDCADKSDEKPEFCDSTPEFRLVDGDGRLEGRVEVKYRGKWGTVCDDDFTDTEAQVVCKSLGFHGKGKVIKNAFGAGSGPIWLDQVSCCGNESSIDKCVHWTWGEHNCNHTEDVSIRCTVTTTTQSPENNGIKGRLSSKQPEIVDSEEVDLYLYQMARSSKMLNDRSKRKCGHFNSNVTDEFDFPEERMQRVILGSKTKRGHHPWQATIRTKGRSGKSTHWCGAVLISQSHLLTAAHCLMGYPKGAYFVRLGDHYANIAESSEIDIFIENWYIHEDFRKGSHMNNDIALIELKSPVHFSDYIQPICLPPKDAPYESGKICTISGWGSIQSGISTPSNQLRAAQVPIIEDSVCKRPTVYGNTITEGMFCAGYLDQGVDACDGDSGGPLVCTSGDAETLYGIISWGQHCGYANKPGVYVKISHYIDWIYEKISFLIQSRRNNN